MPMELQAKLLRFIQTGSFMPVGGGRMHDVDVRFICATNRDPSVAVREGFLREDLYYRLNVVPVHMPPLRERGDDILLLAGHFLVQSAEEEGKRFKKFSKEVTAFLQSHRWSGNVRELENTIRRIVVLNDGDVVEFDMLSVIEQAGQQEESHISTGNASIITSAVPQTADEIRPLKSYERDIILAALHACGGNITEASKRLDINPATIHRKQKQWSQVGA